ncbi:protein-ADP-ribose hydrolase [Nosocomiicoccus sp. HMSC09A07]|uniref:protein-ADP-ribose hydrolase n=1 Tax=Nosocomiicoccus sp. HMSC09A07 TaxID=1581145 RepID=UPI0008A5699F|nr:protein-ADP-ribose hydrolase [Nosocomiicoccus sp. HMSC09A07]OFS63409.1 hypothetical protein HMPREF3177_03035 [Nosocomiicoccus sp. HMSC09A07]
MTLNEVNDLIHYLQDEKNLAHTAARDFEHAFTLYRELVNVRKPKPLPEKYLRIQDEFLKSFNDTVVHLKDLEEVERQIYMFKGDITTLAVDGIVNAANADLLGCFIKGHACIDNIIHTKAGIQLRYECHEIMEAQGRKEAVGRAKITNAYNLPSKYVFHTVGPYIKGDAPSKMQQDLLKQCYLSVLKLADQHNLESVAFCSISTGVFRFPKLLAAEIATHTVKDYLEETNSNLKVIFNVFSDEDEMIYNNILR